MKEANYDPHMHLFDLMDAGVPFEHLNESDKKLAIDEFGSEEAYNRQLMFTANLVKAVQFEKELEPTAAMHKYVMQSLKTSKREGIWLNSFWLLLWPAGMPLYRKPLMQFAGVALLVAGVWQASILVQPERNDSMAQLEEKSIRKDAEPEAENTAAAVEDTNSRTEETVNDEVETHATDSEKAAIVKETERRNEASSKDLKGTGSVIVNHITENTEDVAVAEEAPYDTDDEYRANPAGGFSQPITDGLADAVTFSEAKSASRDINLAEEKSKRDKERSNKKISETGEGSTGYRSIPADDELIDLLVTAY